MWCRHHCDFTQRAGPQLVVSPAVMSWWCQDRPKVLLSQIRLSFLKLCDWQEEGAHDAQELQRDSAAPVHVPSCCQSPDWPLLNANEVCGSKRDHDHGPSHAWNLDYGHFHIAFFSVSFHGGFDCSADIAHIALLICPLGISYQGTNRHVFYHFSNKSSVGNVTGTWLGCPLPHLYNL